MESSTVKKPVLVTIISIIIILSSLLAVLSILTTLRGGSGLLLGYGNMILGGLILLGKLIFSVGLLKMRKWALIGVTTTFVVDIILSFVTAGSLVDPVRLIIKVAVLIYLWSINKKFS